VAFNLAVALAEKGRRTLLVDLDPQGAIGLSLGRGDTEWVGVAELLVRVASPAEALVATKLPALSILPRGRLDPSDVVRYEDAVAEPGALDGLLHDVGDQFAYVIVDTPSGLGRVTRSALTAVGYLLIPFQAEPLAMRSVSQLLRVVEHIRSTDNPELKLLGILPTMVRMGKNTSMDVVSQLWSGFAGVLESVVPWSETYARASQAGLPVGFLAGRVPPEARRFDMLASELEERIAAFGDAGEETHERPQRELL
jgi:chromosome partitioning protein